MERLKNLFLNLILPGIILSGFIGVIVGIIIFFYKLLWNILSNVSISYYGYMKEHIWLIFVSVLAILLLAFVQAFIIKRVPESKGGGIPTSEGIVRGTLNCKPLTTMVCTMFLSFVSLFVGVPLGNEGPSVLVGTTLSNAFSKLLPEKSRAYKKYLMTGGSSTAFAVATGAPIAGILFALEEIHRKFSPMILLVSMSSVIFGTITAYELSNLFEVEFRMFELFNIETIPLNKIFIFIAVGLIVGLIAILFSKIIKLLKNLLEVKAKRINVYFKILTAFMISFILGLVLIGSIGGGHSLIHKLLFENDYKLYILIILFVIKFIMISFCNSSGVTGGMFIPILTLGALIGAILSKIFFMDEYSLLFITSSMVAFMGASIGCPLSAIVFACEALSGLTNIIPIILTVFIAYAVFKISGSNTVYDIILEAKLRDKYKLRDFVVCDFTFTIQKESFACFKTTRDLLLPANAIILSVQRKNKHHFKMDNLGDKILLEGDIITLRAQTVDVKKIEREIRAFFGEQEGIIENVIQEKNYIREE